MLFQENHRINYLSFSISIVLLVLFTYNNCSGFIKSCTQTHQSGFNTSSLKSTVLANTLQYPIFKICIKLFDKLDFKLANNYYNELSKNRLLVQIIIVFQKIEDSISLNRPPGFYFHLRNREIDDPPILS